MDKFEEIYDDIVDSKRENKESKVFDKVDIKDTREYIRAVSGMSFKKMSSLHKHG